MLGCRTVHQIYINFSHIGITSVLIVIPWLTCLSRFIYFSKAFIWKIPFCVKITNDLEAPCLQFYMPVLSISWCPQPDFGALSFCRFSYGLKVLFTFRFNFFFSVDKISLIKLVKKWVLGGFSVSGNFYVYFQVFF